MIYSATLQTYFSEAQKQMEAVMQDSSLDTEAQFRKYVDILDQMTDGIMGQQDTYNALMKKYQEMAAAKGFDLYAPDQAKGQTAKSGGFTAMSQDQGTKLDGMFTSGLQHWSSMDEELEDIGNGLGKALDHLKKIEENTGHCKKLDDIAEDISYIKKNGIKMK